MPLGMELGLVPGHILLYGDPALAPRKAEQPPALFDLCLLWPNGWMHQDTTWYGGRLSPGDIVLDGDLAPPLHRKGHSSRPPTLSGPCLLLPNNRPSQQLLSSC